METQLRTWDTEDTRLAAACCSLQSRRPTFWRARCSFNNVFNMMSRPNNFTRPRHCRPPGSQEDAWRGWRRSEDRFSRHVKDRHKYRQRSRNVFVYFFMSLNIIQDDSGLINILYEWLTFVASRFSETFICLFVFTGYYNSRLFYKYNCPLISVKTLHLMDS